jgi:Zn-dependent peptidase ImmA (M78 family)
MERITVNPNLIRWAIDRSGLTVQDLQEKFPKIEDWISGELFPTMRQLEGFAVKTRTALGLLFLNQPPEDVLPIPDFRTVADAELRRPSPDLLETVHSMQRRQEWMRQFLAEEGSDALPFIGNTTLNDDPLQVARGIRNKLELGDGWAGKERTWSSALRLLRLAVEDKANTMVVINGIVGNNTHRKLDVEEFRGFVLVDDLAPLIFVNNNDAKAAQMFTIAHELAHLWLGREGVFNFENMQPMDNEVEQFCNKVAAEFLVPSQELSECWQDASSNNDPFKSIARQFKVSPLVAARRSLDLNLIDKAGFFAFYEEYQSDERRLKVNHKGRGNFWNNQNVRIGDYFGSAVVQATKEGRLLYRDAYQLTGLHGKTFDHYAAQLGY